uniref:Uncharacterized protein n=1 Tax=Vibrio tasmaniensis TaxID=212663 RepID=A0A0H3ZJM6_9VIBR|nr:hypothetical protein [Vibrio tasmaniensis]AKN38128.1 hypothetical protein [Vibrio tasmaniensis]AKN38319.1 hypothetical protein [Vibrio tasmaniensis]
MFIIPIMLNGRVSYQKQPSEPIKRSWLRFRTPDQGDMLP